MGKKLTLIKEYFRETGTKVKAHMRRTRKDAVPKQKKKTKRKNRRKKTDDNINDKENK